MVGLRKALTRGCLVVMGLLVLGADPALAQTPTESTDPSVLKRELDRPGLRPKAVAPIVVPEIQRPVLPEGAEGVSFVLKSIEVDGNEAISTEQLKRLWKEYLGREIRLADLYEIAAAITVFYRNEGYILSRAIVPPQEIENGVAEIEVVEGFIDSVVIEGDPGGVMSQFTRKIEQIKASKPLHVGIIERYMLLINDLPGVSAASLIRPSPTTPGASELVVVIEETRLNASLSIDNRGSRFIGPLRNILTVNLSNTFGLYDATEFRYIWAHDVRGITTSAEEAELKFGSIKHSQLLNAEGTILDLIYSRTHSFPGAFLREVLVKGRSDQAAVTVTHPLVRSRSENISGQIGFNWLNSKIKTGEVVTSDDRTRWINLIANADFVDRFRGVNLLRLEFQQGLNVLGSRDTGSDTRSLTRPSGRSAFTLLKADVVREQDIGVGWSLFGAITAQYAFNQVLAAQEFSFGGEEFGRGYDTSEIAGDHGIAAKLELRFGGTVDAEYLETYQLFGFYDFGAVFRRDVGRLTGGERDSAASAGFGFRLNFTPSLFSSVELAHPLTRRPTINADDGQKRPRIFFRVTGRI